MFAESFTVISSTFPGFHDQLISTHEVFRDPSGVACLFPQELTCSVWQMLLANPTQTYQALSKFRMTLANPEWHGFSIFGSFTGAANMLGRSCAGCP